LGRCPAKVREFIVAEICRAFSLSLKKKNKIKKNKKNKNSFLKFFLFNELVACPS
jgi:hypothetical protein